MYTDVCLYVYIYTVCIDRNVLLYTFQVSICMVLKELVE